jgi:hypothetical protein
MVRALREQGPQSQDDLAALVGARYWDDGRFGRALMFAVSDGLIVQMTDGRYAVT